MTSTTFMIQRLLDSKSHNISTNRKRLVSSQSHALSSLLVIHDRVQEALARNQPVVALESTIIAHGMPYPENLYLSGRITKILRQKGVEPATIAIKDGICHIGLSIEEIQDLAIAGQERRAVKCSTRELSLLLSKHKYQHKDNKIKTATGAKQLIQWGATTVAATMKLAHIAGISTFVTGGIGGVHRDGQNTLDISTDLIELSRTPVIVVSAGIKSILDIQRTLEVLETYGVPVVAYQTDEFPAFFSSNSGIKTPERVDSVDQIASAYYISQQLGLSHGMLVGVPNTDPAGVNVEQAIQSALLEANELGIIGRDVTPFILKNVALKSQGESLRSNMALVERNTTVGADIAIAVAQHAIHRTVHKLSSTKSTMERLGIPTLPHSQVIVMGGIVLDIVARPLHGQLLTPGTSNPSTCIESDGGVGRNIAETLYRLGSYPLLYSAVGNDSRGYSILRRLTDDCRIVSLDKTVQIVSHANTATYIAILNEHRDLHTACADMEIHQHIVPPPLDILRKAEYLILDANPPIDLLQQTAKAATEAGVKVFLDPTSVAKAKKLCEDGKFLSCLTYASPNLDELYAMAGDTNIPPHAFDHSFLHPVAITVLDRMNPNGAHLIITCGSNGVLLASKVNQSSIVTFQYFPATKNIMVQNATGAGDTLSGAFVHALLNGKSLSDAITFGMEAATMSLQCPDKAISPVLSQSFGDI
jgi:pseudouridine-5'-phosphate glycosidase/sugar/nucleoside kinase (ribokinase family)